MDSQEIGERDRPRFVCQLDRRLHRCNVAKNLDGNPVCCFATFGEQRLRFDQATSPGVEALDPRRGDRFDPEKEPRQSFQADVRRPAMVELSDRCLWRW